jgi:Protein of unknown function (DUF2510)/Protein of unknown function (DUF732)
MRSMKAPARRVAVGVNMSELPAGWYPDQNNASLERYWDGDQWTPTTRSAETTDPAPVSQANSTRKLSTTQRLLPLAVLVAIVLAAVAIKSLMYPDKSFSCLWLADQCKPTVSSQATTSVTAPNVASPNVDFINRAGGDFPQSSNDDLIQLGQLVCDTFRAGTPGWQVIGLMRGKGLTDSQTISLISASVIDFCPQYKQLSLATAGR